MGRCLKSLATPSCLFLLALALNAHRLESLGYGNLFFAAAVRSMITSAHNFFFLAFDPAGFLALDKPPLGFWAQAVSALVLGFNGLSLHLPQVLAGSLAVPVMYAIMKESFGRAGGLAAALALLFTPVWVATSRTIHVDGPLVLVMLLATWSAVRAVHSGRPALAVLCGVLLGVAFNVKYWQALVVLPALGAYLLFSSWLALGRRLVTLLVALGCLLQLCLVWPLAVDSVPARSRPHVANSDDGTVRSLLRNLVFLRVEGADTAVEVGPPGGLRLVTPPLSDIMGTLFPLAFAGLLAAGLWGDGQQRREALLWALWLVPTWIFFSFTRGIVHIAYLAVLAPGIAAGVGMAFGLGARWAVPGGRMALALPLALVLTNFYGIGAWHTPSLAAALGGLGLASLLSAGLLALVSLPLGEAPDPWRRAVVATSLLGTLAPSMAFCWLLTCDAPLGFPMGDRQRFASMVARLGHGDRLVAYLEGHRRGEVFLLATESVVTAAPVILGTGQAVLALGAYGGWEPTVDVPRLEKMVRGRKVRFFLLSDTSRLPAPLRSWIMTHGRPVPREAWAPSQISSSSHPPDRSLCLYDCLPVAPERPEAWVPSRPGNPAGQE